MKQEKKATETVAVEAASWKQVLKCEGESVLTLSLRWPQLPEDTPARRRMGRYYQHVADQWRARWESVRYAQACASLAALRARSLPFWPWEATLDFTVTYHEKGLLSLYMDAYEYTGGAHGNTVRCGDTWSLQNGMPRTLPSFFPPKTHWRRQCIGNLREQISQQVASGEYLYLNGWNEAAATEFDPCRFYLTGDGVTLFYPLYTLAPYVEGIPTFLVEEWKKP